MTMRVVVVAPRLKKEVFLMAIALSMERAEVVLAGVLIELRSGIISRLVRLNNLCPNNILSSLQNSKLGMAR